MSTKKFCVLIYYYYRNPKMDTIRSGKGRPLIEIIECNSDSDAKKVLRTEYLNALNMFKDKGVAGYSALDYKYAGLSTTKGELSGIDFKVCLII